MQQIFAKLPGALLPWYEENRRDLPWRRDREPYRVWLSEIMLQQTRVEAVKAHYLRFLRQMPTVEQLAGCDGETLNKLWEGLGYYTRARNLKKCAQTVTEQYGGVFPRTYEQVLALPGIGPYTAGAICSICYDLPTPAVDGNVLRVVTRLTEDATAIGSAGFQQKVRRALAEIYPAQAGAFTQALMELGATVCGPNREPECMRCPCRGFCGGFLHGTAGQFPVKKKQQPRRVEEKTVFLLSCEGRYALEKRGDTGLLAGLWQFPNVPGHLEPQQAARQVALWGVPVGTLLRQREKRHIFTHIRWEMRGFYFEADAPGGDFTWLTAEEVQRQAALPTAFRQFWEE